MQRALKSRWGNARPPITKGKLVLYTLYYDSCTASGQSALNERSCGPLQKLDHCRLIQGGSLNTGQAATYRAGRYIQGGVHPYSSHSITVGGAAQLSLVYDMLRLLIVNETALDATLHAKPCMYISILIYASCNR